MEERLVAEILATCDSIGYSDDTKYVKDPHALECVKDLVLYLRRDDDDHSVRRLLGRTGVVSRDLLPLLVHYAPQDMELFDVILRLLVNLTHPALLLYDEEVPKNKKYLSFYMEIESQLREVKEAFVNKEVWNRLADRLRTLLNLEWEKRMEDDKLALERILVLTRNVLTIPADPAEEMRTDDEASLHDRLIMVMHLSGLEDLLLFIASSDTTKEYCLHLLELVSVMLRDTSGEVLAKTEATRNEEDRVKDSKALAALKTKEKELKRIQLANQATSRHSRFGGTFCVVGVKGASGRELLCHKPIKSTAELSLDSTKKAKKKASNKVGMQEENRVRRSTVPVRLILKDFCVEFLDNSYNSIMHTVKDNIVRGRMQDHDETYYLWAIKFFMEFNRFQKDFKVSHVSETMSTGAFHYVQTLLDTYHSMMITDKEKVKFWSKRAHMALNAYHELLSTLLWMDVRGSRYVRESSRVIKSNVFYLPEYRELCLGLLNSYDSVRLSKSYLIDLVETNHLFLKMLEDSSKEQGKIIIKTKKRGRKTKKSGGGTKKKRLKTIDEDMLRSEWIDEREDEVKAELSKELVIDEENPSLIPFDAASEITIDDQKFSAVERIAVFLHSGQISNAVKFLRNSREVWPQATELFGSDASDELESLKEIFIGTGSSSKKVLEVRNNATAINNSSAAGPAPEDEENENEDNEEEDEEEEEEEIRETSKEMEFDFFSFLLKYATPKVVSVYGRLWVEEWSKLPPSTLHALLRFFHRLVFQMDYPALLAQVSIFKSFQQLLTVAPYEPKFKEAVKFFKHFWAKFVSLVEKRGSVMWVEALFWKSGREALEIQEGVGAANSASSKATKRRGDWSEDEMSELRLLAEEFLHANEGGGGTQRGKDKRMVDFILLRWTGEQRRSGKAIKKKLIEMELITEGEKSRKRLPKEWGEEEVSRLKEIWEEIRVEGGGWEEDRTNGVDVMERVLGMLGSGRGRGKVVEKMVELGLIRHKSEVGGGKKNKKGEEAKVPTSREFIEDDDTSSSESESEEESRSKQDGPKIDLKGAIDLGRTLMGKGVLKKSVVKWIMQSLKYFVDDLEEDEEESVPLVPIGGEVIGAMGMGEVKKLLGGLGLLEPGQGESYWRIPGGWKEGDVKRRLDALEEMQKEEEEEDIVTIEGGEVEDKEDSEEETKMSTKRVSRDSDENEEVSTGKSTTPKGRLNRSKIVDSDSDDGDEGKRIEGSDNDGDSDSGTRTYGSDGELSSGKSTTPRNRVNRSKIIDSDSEDDGQEEKDDEVSGESRNSRKRKDSSSSSASSSSSGGPGEDKSRVINSDDDKENNAKERESESDGGGGTLKSNAKKRRRVVAVIDSDSD